MPPRTNAGAHRKHHPSARAPRAIAFAALGIAVFGATGCFDQLIAPDTETDGRVTIDNDESALAERLDYVDQVVDIDTTMAVAFRSGQPAMTDGPALAPRAVDLTLVGELEPPTVNGTTLQATAVSRRNNSKHFLVSYNVQGSVFLGGVDYVQGGDSRFPRVKASVRFEDSDVSAVSLSGSALYAAQGTNADGFDSPAAIETLRLSGSSITLTDSGRRDLSSFTATSVQEIDGEIYVTTGDDGHIYALDEDDLSILGQYPLDDARWIEHDADDDRIIVVQGTPGRISIFEEGEFPGGSMVLVNTFPFPGATVPESKSAMDIAGGKAFIAAGAEGVQVMCLDTGEIVGNVPRPDPDALGLDPSVVVTNAVTVDDDLMFISNGEAGVYVAAGADDWDRTDCDDQQSIDVLGRLRFDDLQSVNHVDYRRGYLVVAAGTGGVKIVEVDITR